MNKVVNWKKIAGSTVALLLAEVLVGFIDGTLGTSADLDAAKRRLALSTLLSFSLSTAIFFLAARHCYRPFLHAGLALSLTFAFSHTLGVILPTWGVDRPLILVVLEWLTLGVGLIIGTSAGRYLRGGRVQSDV